MSPYIISKLTVHSVTFNNYIQEYKQWWIHRRGQWGRSPPRPHSRCSFIYTAYVCTPITNILRYFCIGLSCCLCL